jgi:hypothetical protein
VTISQGSLAKNFTGTFKVRESRRKGLLRVDRDHPWHFKWAGTGEHYFLNGTTAYWLLGWEDENVIRESLERLARLKVNRIRVALCGRAVDGQRWAEPKVVPTDKFSFRLNPWVAERPTSVDNPGFDTSRFFLPHWQKCERLLKIARDRDIIVSLIFYLDGKDKGVDPFGKDQAGGEDEELYYRFAIARFASFSNVTWDLANEYQLFRDDAWANKMGEYVRKCDPYDHLMSVHGQSEFHFRTAPWADFASHQSWDEHGGYQFMLENRQKQSASGVPKPQVNEEYGYEDHYPTGWGEDRKAPTRNAESRRRLAWEISMAGGYQTTGERADQGTGKAANTGGGWLNGRGDDAMVLLKGHGPMVEFFKGFEWWKTEPKADVLKEGTGWILAEQGRLYAAYLPNGGTATLALPEGAFEGEIYNPRSGERKSLGEIQGGIWKSPPLAAEADWAILIKKL